MSHKGAVTPDAYNRGHRVRSNNGAKQQNPYKYGTANWAWWLAGWNDRDMGYPLEYRPR